MVRRTVRDSRRRVNSTVMRRVVAMRITLLAMALLVVGCVPVTAQKCFEYGPTVSLTGRLSSQVFPGPPNYQSIRRGDRKETALLLGLVQTICTTGNDPQGFDVPETEVRQVQLAITKEAHWKIARRLVGKHVTVTGTLFHAHTGHHRTKVLIDVANVRAAA